MTAHSSDANCPARKRLHSKLGVGKSCSYQAWGGQSLNVHLGRGRFAGLAGGEAILYYFEVRSKSAV